MKVIPKPPIHASHHCRHYDYVRGPDADSSGPCCKRGLNPYVEGQGVLACLPQHSSFNRVITPCTAREEFTDRERSDWEEHVAHRLRYTMQAIAALPRNIACGSSGSVVCPHCEGTLSWVRSRNGHAWLNCETEHCLKGVHIAIDPAQEWPTK